MQFNIIDTESLYRRLLAAPDADERAAMFHNELITPFMGLVQIFGDGDGVAMFRQWGMWSEQFGSDNRQQMAERLDALVEYDAWGKTAEALNTGARAFAPYQERIPLDTIQFALVLADMSGVPLQRGYSGFGGIPGYILTIYGEPNDYTLPRCQGATVHELHHNIRGAVLPDRPIMIASVADYIVGEGLAESFAAELYGEEVVGFYVTDFDETRLDETRQIIGSALEVSGFNEVRGYIFGDAIAEHMGLPKAGVPPFAGYALGYRVVQAYLERTGQRVAEATFVPAPEIIAGSGFFA